MGLWNRIKVLFILIQLIRHPERTELIFKGVDIVSKDSKNPVIDAIEKRILSNETFKRMHDENFVPERPSLEMLEKMPEGSYGRAVYRHMHENALNFELFPVLENKRPIYYFGTRLYQDHDLWHPLMGYGVEIEDEVALQAFGVAQYGSPIATMIVAGGLMHLMFKNPARAVDALGRVAEGYRRGKNAPFLLSFRLRDYFEKPLEEVRQICGVAS